MSKTTKSTKAQAKVNVQTLDSEVRADLKGKGYSLLLKGSETDEVPDGALVVPEMNGVNGWKVGKDDGRTYEVDSVKFAQRAKDPELYGLSKGGRCPVGLSLLPGEDRPEWLPVTVKVKAKRSNEPKGPRGPLMDDDGLRSVLASYPRHLGVGPTLKLFRAEGHSASGRRVREIVRQLDASAPKTTKPEPKAKQAAPAKVVTKPAPKPSAKKVTSRKPTKKAASSMAKRSAKRSK